jgi:hypothetical protein
MSENIKITITKETKKISRELSTNAERGIYIFAQDVAKRSRRIVPHKSGALRRSLEVTKPKDNKLSIIYDASEKLKYALFMHMGKKYKHPRGQRKFLSDPLFEKAGRLQYAIKAQLTKLLN